tara:strand:+ start:10469 stop:10693 length:225 start_codon:yes stop_codon:yes gene_type:complete
MRGVKYNLSIDIPHGEQLSFNDIDMNETCETIKKTFLEKYFIDVKCNNQIIYNLINRPKTASYILKSKVLINRV